MELFTVSAKLKLDSSEFNREAQRAISSGKNMSDKLAGQINGIAKAIKTFATVWIGGKLVNGIKNVSKTAFNAFADYQQLVGGVETLFKDTAVQVKKFADEAYKTAGLSANEYMETVTSFSASLLQSLDNDTDKAADYADMAVKDMADNANKMGSSMESIQNAYQGFAKQNYTMLDNLKLGYGGTKSEMKRLLDDAGKLTNRKFNLDNLADVYEAIHIIQQEMGITGTTAEEAAHTVSGSMSMMKASWQNLLTTIGSKGNVKKATREFVKSFKTVIDNVKPVMKNIATGLTDLVREIAPMISEELPGFIHDFVPILLKGAVTLAQTFIKAFIDSIPAFVSAARDILNNVISVLKESDSPVLQFVAKALENLKKLVGFVIELFNDFPGAIQKLRDQDSPILTFLADALEVLQKVFQFILDNSEEVAIGIGAVVGAMAIAKVIGFVTSLNPLTIILTAIAGIATLIIANWEGISAFFEGIWSAVTDAATKAWDVIKQFWGVIQPLVEAAWDGVKGFFTGLWDTISGAFTTMWNAVKEFWSDPLGNIEAAWNGIADWLDNNVWQPIAGFFNAAWEAIKTFWEDPLGAISAAWEGVSNWVNESVWQPISEFFSETWEAIETFWEDPLGAISNAWNGVASWFNDNVWSPISSFFTEVWENISQFWADPVGTIVRAWEGLKKWWEDTKATLSEEVKTKISFVMGGISEAIQQFLKLAKQGIQIAVSFVSGATKDAGGAIIDAAAGGDASKAAAIKNTANWARDALPEWIRWAVPSFAKGDWTVPQDDFLARLHRGERVLTASQARHMDENSGMTAVQMSDVVGRTVESVMERVNVYLGADKVGNLTTRRVNKNIKATNNARLRALGG
jgi:phage-related protein